MRIVRWIAVIPGALLLGWLAYMVGGFVNNLTTAWALGEPPTGLMKMGTVFLNNMYFGGAVVFAAVKIAPSAPKIVASVAATVVITLGVLSVVMVISAARIDQIPALLGAMFGAGAAMAGALEHSALKLAHSLRVGSSWRTPLG